MQRTASERVHIKYSDESVLPVSNPILQSLAGSSTKKTLSILGCKMHLQFAIQSFDIGYMYVTQIYAAHTRVTWYDT